MLAGVVPSASAAGGGKVVWELTNVDESRATREVCSGADCVFRSVGTMSAGGLYRQTHTDRRAGGEAVATLQADFTAPPARLSAGQRLRLGTTGTAGGEIALGAVRMVFFYRSSARVFAHTATGDPTGSDSLETVLRIDANPALNVTSDNKTAHFVAPNTSLGTFTITAVGLNFASITWTYRATNTAAPPPPPQEPSPKTKKLRLKINYSMPRRFGIVGPDGLINFPKAPKEVSPARFRVDLVVRPRGKRPCRASDTIRVRAKGARRIERTSGCRFSAYFPKEGRYTVRATLKGKDGATGKGQLKLLVQDWLIFGLGDSNASGEGAPDISAPPFLESPFDTATWQDAQCHRSANSWQPQAARAIENRDPKTSVTFAHLACSGATVRQGLLGAYSGRGAPTLAPQLLQMRRLARKREIDAVLISVGVNDIGFADVVVRCLALPSCQRRAFPRPSSQTTLDQVMQKRIAGLPKLFNRLSRSLKRLGIPARHVFISEYPDTTRGQNGKFCDPLIKVEAEVLAQFAPTGEPMLLELIAAAASQVVEFSRAETEWAYKRVLVPLNKALRAAAQKHGWRLVTGVAKGFRRHGNCSNLSWIVGILESLERQRGIVGLLHANSRGHALTARLAARALRLEFYPKGFGQGPARPPRR